MAVTRGKLQFEDDNANILEVALPVYPSHVEVVMPFDIVKLDNNSYAYYDPGSTFDKRSGIFTLQLGIDEAKNFNSFFGTSSTIKGRATEVTMRMYPGSGFFPFGADKGDIGDFEVVLTILSPLRMINSPFKLHTCKIRVDNVGSWGSYSITPKVNYGKITIGTVENIYFPESFFKPKTKYSCSLTLTEDSTPEWVDMGETADSWETSASFTCNTNHIASILNFLSVTARTSFFSMSTGSSDYAFGVDKSPTKTYVCRLIDKTIKVTNTAHDIFKITLNLYLEDTV